MRTTTTTKHEEAKLTKTHEGVWRGEDKDKDKDKDEDKEMNVRAAVRGLVAWYDGAKREMPWRGLGGARDAYAIWVSETMLQQTQVATVVPYYLRFMERFPTVAALAAAELGEVLSAWAGLGYYRRAKHLHAGAREVASRHGGRVPGTFEELLALPGIGRYTAGAIGSIAFGLPVPVVDGNVMRVLARVYGYGEDIGVAKNQGFFWEKAQAWVLEAPRFGGCGKSSPRFGDVNQAVMELGATVCVPVSPKCGACPLSAACVARREGRVAELPVKGAKKATPVVRRVALVVLREKKDERRRTKDEMAAPPEMEVLVMQRPAGGLWEHMWEFPTEPVAFARVKGRRAREGSETPGAGLGLELRDVRACGEVMHQLTHRRMVYEVVVARGAERRPPKGGTPSLTPNLPACDDGRYVAARWVSWPLARESNLAMAKVVAKIATKCCEGT